MRSDKEVADFLKEFRKAAQKGIKVMPYLVPAVKTYSTVEEITDVFREVFGEFKESGIV